MKKIICAFILLITWVACKKEPGIIIYYESNNIVAHRGAWQDGHCPQNSLASLHKAIEMKCIGSEFDVWLTKDDSLVVEHDPEYAGQVVERSTYASLSKTKLSNGEVLPTLRQYLLAASGQDQTKLFLEVKSLENNEKKLDHATDRILDLVEKTQMQGHMIYTSFYLYPLQRIHRRFPSAITQFLGGTYSPDNIKSAGISGINYEIDSFYKHSDWLPSARADSLVLGAWVVDDAQQYIWLVNNKVDYIITDVPNTLFRALDKMR
jgi:glycerophosphoryl diester phosphodiesterase